MKRFSTGFMILLLLIGITSGFVGGTIAKYTGEVTGSGAATVAHWAFETDNASTSSFDVNISTTADETTLAKMKKDLDLKSNFAELGLGWLARENKVDIQQKGPAVKISLK